MSKQKIRHLIDLLKQVKQKSKDAEYASRQAGILRAAWLRCRNKDSVLAKKRWRQEDEWEAKRCDASSDVSINIYVVTEKLKEMMKNVK